MRQIVALWMVMTWVALAQGLAINYETHVLRDGTWTLSQSARLGETMRVTVNVTNQGSDMAAEAVVLSLPLADNLQLEPGTTHSEQPSRFSFLDAERNALSEDSGGLAQTRSIRWTVLTPLAQNASVTMSYQAVLVDAASADTRDPVARFDETVVNHVQQVFGAMKIFQVDCPAGVLASLLCGQLEASKETFSFRWDLFSRHRLHVDHEAVPAAAWQLTESGVKSLITRQFSVEGQSYRVQYDGTLVVVAYGD